MSNHQSSKAIKVHILQEVENLNIWRVEFNTCALVSNTESKSEMFSETQQNCGS